MKMSNVLGLATTNNWRYFFKALLIMVCALMIFGCRTYSLYHYQDRQDTVLGGELVVEVVPSRSLSDVGKKTAIEGNPYSLLFIFFSTCLLYTSPSPRD